MGLHLGSLTGFLEREDPFLFTSQPNSADWPFLPNPRCRKAYGACPANTRALGFKTPRPNRGQELHSPPRFPRATIRTLWLSLEQTFAS